MKSLILKDKYIHNGTSQFERLLAALSPDAFKIDDRSVKEILDATYRYAKQVCYYNEENHLDGDWTDFWEVETLTFLAVLSAIDTDQVKTAFQAILEKTENIIENAETTEIANDAYLEIIEHLKALAEKINNHYQKLPNDIPFKKEILTFIRRDRITDAEQLEGALQQLIAFHKEAFGATAPEEDENEGVLNHGNYEAFFGDVWGIQNKDDFYNINPDTEYLEKDGLENLQRLFTAFHEALTRIQSRACYWFDQNLETPQLRQPHVALYLTFLKLFQHSRDAMNDLTHKHLEFYYEKILHLRRRKAVPDEVHLLFELANNVDNLLVEKGTKLLAGKKDGKNLLFETVENWVFNKAQVVEIKNTYLDLSGKLNNTDRQIYASPDVSLAYENGDEAPNQTADTYRGFGDDLDIPKGEVGFAVASPQLILREGRRTILLKINFEEPQSIIFDNNHFKIFFSSNDNWIEILPTTNDSKFGFQIFYFSNSEIHFRIYLEEDTPPFIKLSPDLVQESRFDTPWPLLRLFLNKDYQPSPEIVTTPVYFMDLYEELKCAKIKNLTIDVAVGIPNDKNIVGGIQENLIIQNDLGVFDGTQKFFPFGSIPEKGDHFYIGSTEIFQKALNTLQVCFDWIAPPENFIDHYNGYIDIDSIGANGKPADEPSIFETPYVLIDFIDRAKIELPQAVVRTGSLQSLQITGTVTNIQGEELKDVLVANLIALNNNANTDIEGKYLIDDVTATSFLFFSAAIQEESQEPYKKYVAREFVQNNLFDSENILIDGAGKIDVVLFRPIQDRSPYLAEAPDLKIVFIVKDIFGIPISDALFLNQSDNPISPDPANSQFPNGVYVFTVDVNTIVRVKQGTKILNLETADFNNYSIFGITLFPTPVSTEGNSNANGISGTVRDKSNTFLENAKITIVHNFVDNGGNNIENRISTFSDSIGEFSFSAELFGNDGIAEIIQIIFSHPTHETFIYEESPSVSKLNIRLHLPKKIAKFQGEVSGVIPENLSSSVKIFGRESNLITLGDEYSINSNNDTYFKNDSLIYDIETSNSNIEYYPNQIGIFKSTEINPVFVKKYEILDGDPDLEEVKVIISNLDGEIIDNQNFPNNDITNPLPINSSGYLGIQIPNVPVNSIINVILLPDPIIGNPTTVDARTSLSGQITGISTSQLVKVSAYDDGNQLIYSTFSVSGSYNLKYLPSSHLTIEFSHPEYQTVVIKEEDNLVANNFYSTLNINLIQNLSDFSRKPNPQSFPNSVGGRLFELLDSSPSKTQAISGRATVTVIDTTSNEIRKTETTNSSFIIFGVEPNDTLVFYYENDQNQQFVARTSIENYQDIEVMFCPDSFHKIVKGVVRDAHEENPIGNVEIYLKDDGNSPQPNTFRHTKSDPQGNYEIHIPPFLEIPTLEFHQSGFAPVKINIQEEISIVNPSDGVLSQLNAYSWIDAYLNFEQLNRLPLVVQTEEEKTEIECCYPININSLNLVRDIRTQNFERYSPTLKRGFVRLSLDGSDLLHKEYQNLLVACAIIAAKNNTFNLPPQPYTPATNGISVAYTSEQQIFPIPEEETENENTTDQFYHLLPFNGHKALNLKGDSIPFLYPFTPIDGSGTGKSGQAVAPDCKMIAHGNLYLGIENLPPGGTLSLLFQLKEGTEKNFEHLPPELHWSYLSKDNTWLAFSVENILKDTTLGLTRTGIVQLQIPYNVVTENTLLNDELYWIRVTAVEVEFEDEEEAIEANPKKSARALPDLEKVTAQAIEAKFVAELEDKNHLVTPKPLAAGKIKKLLVSNSKIKKINQPFPSFNGRLPEQGNSFYQRISERLRHGNRAVTVWDYERLLLERFPKVYRTKCLRHAHLTSGLAPGHVLIAAIPDLRQRDFILPYEPRFSRGDLEEMAVYLRSKTNFFVAQNNDADEPYLRVENALYEPVKIFVDVVFKPSVDAQFYEKKLNEALKGFIAPWLYDKEADISFQRIIDKSHLIQFIEHQEYVENIQCCGLTHCGEKVTTPFVVPTTSWSILTSDIAHDICVIPDVEIYKSTFSEIDKCEARLSIWTEKIKTDS